MSPGCELLSRGLGSGGSVSEADISSPRARDGGEKADEQALVGQDVHRSGHLVRIARTAQVTHGKCEQGAANGSRTPGSETYETEGVDIAKQ